MKSKQYIVLLILAVATAGCHLIDDDLSVCGVDYLINYEMRFVTEVQTTIEEQLSSDIDEPVAETLRAWSEPYYSGHAHDLDMSFFSLAGTDELLEHKSDIINANQKTYTLYIPRRDYRHLAVVNIADNENVSIMGEQYASSMRIVQREADTLNSHNTAVYTARMEMYMTNDSNLSFHVHLYMASCGVAIVMAHDGSTIPKVRNILLEGTATGFNVNDSVYSYEKPSLIRVNKLTDRCYAALSLPSPDSISSPHGSRANAKIEDDALWKVRVYTTMPDGKITETVLSIPYALRAGTLEIIKLQLQDDGSVVIVGNAEVGITVTLDWKEGDEHNVEI